MRLRREYWIGDSLWRVERLTSVDADDAKGRTTYGFCDVESQTIEILKGLDEMKLVQTFVHELLHAVSDEYGVKIPHELIYQLDGPIARFIVDNFL